MAVSFFGGQNGAGSRVWSAGKFVTNQQDQEQLRARIRELESLCTDVLVAGVDIGLPQHLLNQLWAAVGNGELPHAFHVDLPPAPPRPVEATQGQKVVVAADAFTDKEPGTTAAMRAPMEIPDIPLTTNPLTAKDDEARVKPPQAELKPLNIKKTVCVVDDDPMMLDVLARILQRENFELLMATGGPEIIKQLSEHPGAVDLLVTDYAMPEMQGRELAEHVRQRFPAVKVLYQTGFSDMLFENRIELEEGAAFLEKPFTARGLREAARLVLFGSINP
ncbi:MAG TPA: response regulator [Vicinamibacterales bacterium]|nr:response regulator [Vicinamibacterales bacterium]